MQISGSAVISESIPFRASAFSSLPSNRNLLSISCILSSCVWNGKIKLSIWNSLETRFFSPCRPWFSTSRTEFNPVKFALELKILRTTDGFVKCGGQALALKFLRNYSQKAIFFYKFLYFSKRKMAFCLV
jgi:hypothetical protein